MAGSMAATLFDEDVVREFERDAAASFAPYFDERPESLSSRLRADLSEWLPHNLLHKVDRASMAFSLEARVPYLALPVVRFVVGLPDDAKIRGGETKRLLRRAVAGLVPDAIISRPKQGFDLPLGAWLRGPLRSLAAARLDEHVSPAGRAERKRPRRSSRVIFRGAGFRLAAVQSAFDQLFLERHGD
jgi:asparagine synthetase B (glutamine-hydrolysing)